MRFYIVSTQCLGLFTEYLHAFKAVANQKGCDSSLNIHRNFYFKAVLLPADII